MTPEEFTENLKRAGLTQTKFANIIGKDPRQVRRWQRGDVPVPQAELLILQMLVFVHEIRNLSRG